MNRSVRLIPLILVAILAGCQTPSRSGIRASSLSNFGVVEPGKLYRGDAPQSERDIAYLAKTYHIRTIIDLRDTDGNPAQEKAWVDHVNATLGDQTITWINLPCDAFAPKTVLDRFRFFLTQADAFPRPVFVHCQYGRDRTGLFVAAYQITQMDGDARLAADTMRNYGQNFIVLPALYDLVRGLSKVKILGQRATTQAHPQTVQLSTSR